jgi:hypothetical protein
MFKDNARNTTNPEITKEELQGFELQQDGGIHTND